MSDALDFARQLLPLVAAFALLFVVVVLALRYQVVGVLLALAGVGGMVWGSWYALGALSPENRSNELKEVAIAFGIAAIIGGGLLTLVGARSAAIAAKGKAARTSPKQHLAVRTLASTARSKQLYVRRLRRVAPRKCRCTARRPKLHQARR